MKNKFIALTVSAALAVSAVYAFAAPGTDDDPLVSLSYITDTLIPEIHSYVDAKIAKIGNTSAGEQSVFKVVDVKKGQMIKCGDGCEMILRMGSGTIVASDKGGISDVTTGIDLGQDEAMPANHMLIAPLGDGRGVKMTTNGKVMIKGTYTLK
jgi:hypothetical protein